MTLLETRNLSYFYPDGTSAIREVDLRIERGEKIAFVGPNGSGKSTLFLLLNGTLRPAKGEVLFNDRPLRYDSSSLRTTRKKVGIVFQNSDDQLFAPTVRQDVGFGPTNLGLAKDEVERKVEMALEYVGIEKLKDRPPHHLSGGQKKRAAIAGVMAMDPEVMILDEPLSNLDPAGSEEVMELLEELNERGTTIIISTHDVDLAYRWSERVYLLADGRIADNGRPEEIFGDSKLIFRSGLRQPLIMEVYDEISKRELASIGKRPRSVPELVGHLTPPDLRWMKVPPGTVVGATIYPGEIDNAKYDRSRSGQVRVVHLQEGGRAVVESLTRSIRIGGVIVYNTDRQDIENLTRLLEEIDLVGVMGTRSRAFAEKHGISADIASNVIDRTILRTLCGDGVLVLTNGGMVEHARRRIEDYGRQSGIGIGVVVFNGEIPPKTRRSGPVHADGGKGTRPSTIV
jgi:cobalt/nickel transport system ATP-binding protein